MDELKRYRLLIGIYVVAVLAGLWEYSSTRSSRPDVGEVDWYAPGPEGIAATVKELRPDSADALYMNAMQAYNRGASWDEVRRLLEQALATGVRQHEDLYYYHVHALIRTRAAPFEIDAAIRRWRRNYPRSERVLSIPVRGFVGRDPLRAAQKALGAFAWTRPEDVSINQAQATVDFKVTGVTVKYAESKAALGQAGFEFD